MAKEIDVRGLFCPQPVMLVKKAIDAGETEIVVFANDPSAVGNVKRLGENSGFTIEAEEQDDKTLLRLTKF